MQASQQRFSSHSSNTCPLAAADTVAPTFNALLKLDVATQNSPYFSFIPLSALNVEAGSAAVDIDVISATADVNTGLTLTVGKLGRAYISGTPSSQPATRTLAACGASAGNWVVFTVTFRDEAGNTAAPAICIRIETATTSSLTVGRTAISTKEGDAAKSLDTSAVYTGSAAYKVVVYLEAPDYYTTTTGTEALTTTFTTGTYTVGAFVQDGAHVGSLSLTALTTSAVVVVSDVQSFVRGIGYSNTRTDGTPGYRTIRAVVYKYVSAGVYQVLNYASRNVYFGITNSKYSV